MEPTKRELYKLQKREVNAVIAYKALEERYREAGAKDLFSDLATDGGRHALILKGRTDRIAEPTGVKKAAILCSMAIFGQKTTANLLANGKARDAERYGALANEFPELDELARDAQNQAARLTNFAEQLR